MLDRSWYIGGWPKKGYIKRLTYPSTSAGDGAAVWVASTLWHHYKTVDGLTFPPKVVKVWDWGWKYIGVSKAPFGKSRHGDVDLMIGEKAKSRKIKFRIRPISKDLYETSIIEWKSGKANPVKVLWASTTEEGTNWHYIFFSYEKNPYFP